MQLKPILFKCYRLLPETIKCLISRLVFKPKMGKRVHIFGKVQFEGDVEIGDYSYIHGPAHLGNIHIGKFCSIAKNLSCITTNHDLNLFSTYPFADGFTEILELRKSPGFEKFKPLLPKEGRQVASIGNDVWIGENVTILSGVTIGDGAVIGACSLVLHDIPPYAVAVGYPAKVKRYRLTDEKIEVLKKLQWWNWPINKIAENFESLDNFNSNITVQLNENES